MRRITCIVCPNGCSMTIEKSRDGWKIEGNMCKRGMEFAIAEVTDPKRTVCSTVRTRCREIPRLPVRSSGEIPKDYIMPVMKEINRVRLEGLVHSGDVIIRNVLDTGIDIIATSDMYLYGGGERVEG